MAETFKPGEMLDVTLDGRTKQYEFVGWDPKGGILVKRNATTVGKLGFMCDVKRAEKPAKLAFEEAAKAEGWRPNELLAVMTEIAQDAADDDAWLIKLTGVDRFICPALEGVKPQEPQRCQYATPQPVLKGGKRVESISREQMAKYMQGGPFYEGKIDVTYPGMVTQLKQEQAYLRSQCNTLAAYPMCPVHGENVSVVAEIAEDTKKVTAMFVCERCKDAG